MKLKSPVREPACHHCSATQPDSFDLCDSTRVTRYKAFSVEVIFTEIRITKIINNLWSGATSKLATDSQSVVSYWKHDLTTTSRFALFFTSFEKYNKNRYCKEIDLHVFEKKIWNINECNSLFVFSLLSPWLPQLVPLRNDNSLLIPLSDLHGLCRNWCSKKLILSAQGEILFFLFQKIHTVSVCMRVVGEYRAPAVSWWSWWTHWRQKPQLQLPSPITFPLTGVNKGPREMSLQHFKVTRTLFAFRNETAFTHYANHIDSISNAFIRLIMPKVKSVHSEGSVPI